MYTVVPQIFFADPVPQLPSIVALYVRTAAFAAIGRRGKGELPARYVALFVSEKASLYFRHTNTAAFQKKTSERSKLVVLIV